MTDNLCGVIRSSDQAASCGGLFIASTETQQLFQKLVATRS
jgi:hypothetical protein